MNARENLNQALDSIICASIRRDRPDAAEELTAAIGQAIVEQIRGEFHLREVCRAFEPYWSSEQRAAVSRWIGCQNPPKDPDVAELLAAMHADGSWWIDTGTDFPLPLGAKRVQEAYRRVKAKYES